MAVKNKSIANEPLEPLIFIIRGHRVILDADLARLYGVNTRVPNQGVRRNSHRFPDDFAFQLTGAEVGDSLDRHLLLQSAQQWRSMVGTRALF